MSKILSLILLETATSLLCRILDMDESLRIANNDFSYKSSTGLEVKSFLYPEVNERQIYLRGSNKEMDDEPYVVKLMNETPSSLKRRAIRALEEFLMEKFNCNILVEQHPGYQGETLIHFSEFKGISQAFTKE